MLSSNTCKTALQSEGQTTIAQASLRRKALLCSEFSAWLGGGYEFSRDWLLEAIIGYGNPTRKAHGVKGALTATMFGVTLSLHVH